jgi:hypothetical protein
MSADELQASRKALRDPMVAGNYESMQDRCLVGGPRWQCLPTLALPPLSSTQRHFQEQQSQVLVWQTPAPLPAGQAKGKHTAAAAQHYHQRQRQRAAP